MSIRLRSTQSHYCSGSLVYKRFILTTAHCFNSFTGNPRDDLYVITGKTSLEELADPFKDAHLVSDLIIHPEYNKNTVQHDIAFIRLAADVELNARVKLICLPESSKQTDIVFGKYIMGVGWGRTTPGPNDPSQNSNVLKQTTLRVLNGVENEKRCETHPFYDEKLMYCVIGVRGGANFCWGDSGGPMSVKLNERWTVFGNTNTLAVKDDGSCDPLMPAYYTKLPLYLDWMTTFIK